MKQNTKDIKNRKLGTKELKIKVKEENYNTLDTQRIISLLLVQYLYTNLHFHRFS